MPLNATPDEINRTATRDFQEKLRLEKRMRGQLRSLFREMAKDLETSVATTGQPQSASLYIDDIRGIHASQARRVSSSFSSEILGFLQDSIGQEERAIIDLEKIADTLNITVEDLIERMIAETRFQVREYNATQVNQDTALITRTNQEEMDIAVAKAWADNPDVNNRQIGRIAARDFRTRGQSRAATISATFTQKIAENTKNTERQTYFNTRNGFAAAAAQVEFEEELLIWVSRGDSVVRPAHLAADFTQAENGVFTVGGEQLRFPGDISLGASAGNTINCRCSSVTSIQ